MNLKNKVAVVTGANRGIGLKCVEMLLEEGAVVFGICRSGCSTNHPAFSCIHADVGDLEQLNLAFDSILDKCETVDILINNAGLGYFDYCEKLDVDHWQEMFRTNVFGTFYTTRRVISGMKIQKSGHIINIASTAGLEGFVQASGYCATKFAVRGFSESLFREVRDFGIKVTCVYPGSVKTDFFRHHPGITPHDYMLMPEDIAGQILFALKSPPNVHHVNLEIRPLQPKGPRS